MILSYSTRPLFITLLLICGVLLGGHVQAEVARLIGIQPVTLPGNRAQVRFDFTLPPPMPQVHAQQTSPDLILDFWGVENETAQQAFPIGAGPLKGIALGQYQGRMRATVGLMDSIPYRLFSEGNSLFLEISPLLDRVVATPPAEPAARKLLQLDSTPTAPTRLLAMEFEHEGDTGRVVLTLSDDRAGVDLLEEGHNVVVNLLGARLSEKMEQQLEVGQFGTPLLFLDAFGSDGNASIQIKPDAVPYDYRAWQIDNRLILEFSPERLVSSPDLPDVTPYDGNPITLGMQQVSLRTVLQVITEAAGQKLVVSESVDDQISLRLINIPWRPALDLVMKHYQLELRQFGDVVVVLGGEDLEQGSAMSVAAGVAKATGTATPVLVANALNAPNSAAGKVAREKQLRTEMMPVQHQRAGILAEQLRNARLLSEVGTIQVDDSANLLVVTDTDKARNRIRDVLGKLDVIVYRSLVLQAQVVAAPSGIADKLGVRWSNMAPSRNGLRVGYRQGDGQLPMLLNQLDAAGTAELVSSSESVMQSGDEVSIERARELTPLLGRRPGQYQDVVLSLDVMSRIQQGGRILMDVNIARDIISQVDLSGEMSISNNELVSSVVVPDGDALVLTGFLGQARQARYDARDTAIPQSSLGNPGISHQNSAQDMELLIFITPILASNF